MAVLLDQCRECHVIVVLDFKDVVGPVAGYQACILQPGLLEYCIKLTTQTGQVKLEERATSSAPTTALSRRHTLNERGDLIHCSRRSVVSLPGT
jgi:hypothetical protein